MSKVLTTKKVKCPKCKYTDTVVNDEMSDKVYVICSCGFVSVVDFKIK